MNKLLMKHMNGKATFSDFQKPC